MKMSKKILSVILAVLMAFSTFAVTLSASAAEADPEVTVTADDRIDTILADVAKFIDNKLNGSTIEAIYKAFPGIPLFSGTARPTKWSSSYDFFKDIGDEKYSPNGELTKDGLNRFFEDHHIVTNGIEDVQEELNHIATFIGNTLDLNLMAMLDTTNGLCNGLIQLQNAFDEICDGLDIEQPKKAGECTYVHASTIPYDSYIMVTPALTTQYIQNLINGLFPNVIDRVVDIIQGLVSADKGPVFYKAVIDICGALKLLLKNDTIKNLVDGLIEADPEKPDATPLSETITNICTKIEEAPTFDEGTDNERFDLQSIIPYILDTLGGAVAENVEVRFDKAEFDESFNDAGYTPENPKTITLLFKPMADDLAKVAAAETTTEAIKGVVDYLYETVLQNKYNNYIVYGVFDGVADSFIKIPENVAAIGKDIVDPADDDVENVPRSEVEILTMAASAVGEELVDHHLNLEAVAAKAATCSEEGIAKDCFYCSYCKNYFATDDEYQSEALNIEDVIIAPTGIHVFGEVVEAKAATYFKEGNKAYKQCTECGKNFAPDAEETAADEDAIDVTVAKVEGTLGSISKDEVVDTLDLLMLQRNLVGSEDFDDVQLALADVNGDEKIDPQDLLAIKQFLVGKIKGFDEVQKVNQ